MRIGHAVGHASAQTLVVDGSIFGSFRCWNLRKSIMHPFLISRHCVCVLLFFVSSPVTSCFFFYLHANSVQILCLTLQAMQLQGSVIVISEYHAMIRSYENRRPQTRLNQRISTAGVTTSYLERWEFWHGRWLETGSCRKGDLPHHLIDKIDRYIVDKLLKDNV